MEIAKLIIPLGIITITLLFITALFGLRTKILKSKIRIKVHYTLAALALIFSIIHAVLVIGVKTGIVMNRDIKLISSDQEGYKEIISKEISMKWKVIGKNLDIIIRAPTKGWVSVGFNPSYMMQDANIIIGYVKNEKTFIQDHFGSSYTNHSSDISLGGTEDVTLNYGKEKNNTTEIAFSIPLVSDDKYDSALKKGKKYSVILAYGENDDLKSVHKKRTSLKITLE